MTCPAFTGRAALIVPPKYRNPMNPAEVFGPAVGSAYRWLEPQIAAGKELDDFLIRPATRQ
jgi:hypothetical protein